MSGEIIVTITVEVPGFKPTFVRQQYLTPAGKFEEQLADLKGILEADGAELIGALRAYEAGYPTVTSVVPTPTPQSPSTD